MKKQNHIIKKQLLDLTLDSEIGSFALQSRVSDIFKTEILPLIDAHCTSLSEDSRIFRVDRLELDLGTVDKKNLATEFKRKVNELFPEKLAASLGAHPHAKSAPVSMGFYDDGRVAVTSENRDFELLEFFLKEGRLPWWVKQDEFFDLPTLLEEKVKKQPAKVKKMITEIVHHPASVKRLLYHTGKPVLERMIGLFYPQESTAVSKLAHELVTVFVACPYFAAFSPGRARLEIWLAVLSQSFASAGRVFDRRLMAKTVIGYLAKTFDVNYNSLLSYLGKTAKAGGYGVLKQLNLQELAAGDHDWPRRPWMTGVFDERTSAYLQQLETIERLSEELQLILSGKKMPRKSKAKAQQITEEFMIRLKRSVKAIQNIRERILTLLKKTDSVSIFTLSPAEREEGLRDYGEEFNALIERLNQSLLAFLDQTALKVDGDLLNKTEKIIASIHELRKRALSAEELAVKDSFSASEEFFLRNAGIVLLWPYLIGFLETVGLMKEKEFLDDEARERGVLLLHYLAFGNGEGREYDLTLNKILCGMDPTTPVRPSCELTPKEKGECENLLEAVVFNWSALKNLSVPGLRSMFLQREGMVFIRDDYWVLRAKEESFDILLDKMPWGIGTIRLPWMERLLFVEWRGRV